MWRIAVISHWLIGLFTKSGIIPGTNPIILIFVQLHVPRLPDTSKTLTQCQIQTGCDLRREEYAIHRTIDGFAPARVVQGIPNIGERRIERIISTYMWVWFLVVKMYEQLISFTKLYQTADQWFGGPLSLKWTPFGEGNMPSWKESRNNSIRFNLEHQAGLM